MNTYKVLVKWNADVGSGHSYVTINADSVYQAIQLAKAMYGNLLISESAISVQINKY